MLTATRQEKLLAVCSGVDTKIEIHRPQNVIARQQQNEKLMWKKKERINMERTDRRAAHDGPRELLVRTEGTPPQSHDEVAALAYKLWQERGCPIGSEEQDWYRAEDELREHKPLVRTAGG
jgi:hypothetical protein